MEEAHLNKTSRILYIYTKLLQGEVLKKRELAEQTGVNEKSIQRDLNDIRSFLDDIKIFSKDIRDLPENKDNNAKNREDRDPKHTFQSSLLSTRHEYQKQGMQRKER